MRGLRTASLDPPLLPSPPNKKDNQVVAVVVYLVPDPGYEEECGGEEEDHQGRRGLTLPHTCTEDDTHIIHPECINNDLKKCLTDKNTCETSAVNTDANWIRI